MAPLALVRQLLLRIAGLRNQTSVEADLDQEMGSHLDLAADDYVRQGYSAEEARRLARLSFGSIEASKDAHRDSRGLIWIETLAQDLRFAGRTFRSNPAFALVAIATLAVGIGLNSAVFTVTNAVLFKGFRHVTDNSSLVYINNRGCCIPFADYEDYRKQARSFSGIELVHGTAFVFSNAGELARQIQANENTAGVFRLLGVQPMLGRDFTHEDEQPGAREVTILSYGFWESQFGKDPDIVGRSIRLNGIPVNVIGVMQEGFSFPQRVDIWTPLVRTAQVLRRDNVNTWCAVARLKPDVTLRQAQTEINTLTARLRAEYPNDNQDVRPQVQTFRDFFVGTNATQIYGAMWGAVGFVLLIACANLANLLLARAMTRSREIGVRMALGAARWRVVRQLLIESLTLSGLGGIGGWWLARAGVWLFESAMLRRVSWLVVDYRMDARILLYLTAVSVATGILFGLAPALHLTGWDIQTALKSGARGVAGARRGIRLSSALIATEVALAMVLLAGAGVLIRSFWNVANANLGVNVSGLISANVGDQPSPRKGTTEDRVVFFERIREHMRNVPGVDDVTMAGALPSYGGASVPLEVAGRAPEDPAKRERTISLTVAPGYFAMFGARVLAGRDFAESDAPGAQPVAIVNEKFASRYWPGQNPLGKSFRLFQRGGPGAWLTVVGVSSNIVQNDFTRQNFYPIAYRPFRQEPLASMRIVLRTRLQPAAALTTFREELLKLTPGTPIYGPFLVEDEIASRWDAGLFGIVFGIFAAVALLLAAVGIYAVIANTVDQRRQEIGIRISLGATSQNIAAMVCSHGMLPLLGGFAAGLSISMLVNRLLTSELVRVEPADPISLGLAAGVLALFALMGCLMPARRAARVDPAVCLRAD